MNAEKLIQFQQIMEMEQKPPANEWIFDPVQYDYICYYCKEHSEYKTRYCPNCGAKMKVEE